MILYPPEKHPSKIPPICQSAVQSLVGVVSITSTYEWEMKNFLSHSSSDILPNLQTPESRQDENDENDDDEDKARCEWDFHLSTVVSSSVSANGGAISDTIGVVEFDPSYRLLATGGISRKIRIYSSVSLLRYDQEGGSSSYEQPHTAAAPALLDHANACDFYICTPAKLSSLRWKPGSGGAVLGSADYDGVVMEYDLEKRLPVFERDEHGGRRVWSMDYSPGDPVVGASGSDDGTMQVWDPRCDGGECLAAVQPSPAKSPVCCVEFNPFRGELVAVGCADSRVYGYDLRRMGDPLMVLSGHQKAVTHIRFLDHRTIVTSGIDGSLKTWRAEDQRVIRTYTGHANSRRFVGLSVWRSGGLLSCGSEDNRLVVYDKRWGDPIWVRRLFDPVQVAGAPGLMEGDQRFVSSVCWRQLGGDDKCTLVAGGSDGVLQVFSGRRRIQ